MTVSIVVAGVSYPVPSGAGDTNWAAQQVALLKALAAAVAVGPAVQKLYLSSAIVGSGADTTEDTLSSYTLPAATLAVGKGLHITAWGDGVNTADATTVRAYIGASNLLTKILTPSQSNQWRMDFDIIPIDVANAAMSFVYFQDGIVPAFEGGRVTVVTLDVTTSKLLKFTGQRAVSSVASSLVQRGMIVTLLP